MENIWSDEKIQVGLLIENIWSDEKIKFAYQNNLRTSNLN